MQETENDDSLPQKKEGKHISLSSVNSDEDQKEEKASPRPNSQASKALMETASSKKSVKSKEAEPDGWFNAQSHDFTSVPPNSKGEP